VGAGPNAWALVKVVMVAVTMYAIRPMCEQIEATWVTHTNCYPATTAS